MSSPECPLTFFPFRSIRLRAFASLSRCNSTPSSASMASLITFWSFWPLVVLGCFLFTVKTSYVVDVSVANCDHELHLQSRLLGKATLRAKMDFSDESLH